MRAVAGAMGREVEVVATGSRGSEAGDVEVWGGCTRRRRDASGPARRDPAVNNI